MPTYDYECDRCKARYELRQGFDAASTHTCEECGQGTAKRVLTAPTVVFKGSGWYVTDSRKSSSSSSSSSDSSSTSAASPSANVSSEASGSSGSDSSGAAASAAG